MNQRFSGPDDFAALTQADLPNVALVQPFLESILRIGEQSLIFFDGIFSHAVVKLPLAGDYRVQEEFGGSVSVTHPAHKSREVAEQALAGLLMTPTYARIDIVEGDDGPMVMEIELIEPELYIDR